MVALRSLVAVLVLSPTFAHADASPQDSYQDYVLRVCGQAGDKIDGACADKFKNLQVLMDRWNSVCKEPTDPGSPFYQEQLDEAHSKCPVRKSGQFAPIPPETWAKMPAGERKQELQDLEDFRVGFDRTAGLYHELMTTDGWKAKDLIKQLNKDTVGIVPSFGAKDKAHLTVREAIYVYLGADGLNKLIGAKDLKGKPQAAQAGNNGATSRFGQLDAKDRKLDAQMKQSGKKAKELAKSLEKANALQGKLDDNEAAGYVADLGSAGRFWSTQKEAAEIAKTQNKVVATEQDDASRNAHLDQTAKGIETLPFIDRKAEAVKAYNACGATDIFCSVNAVSKACGFTDLACQRDVREKAARLKNPPVAETAQAAPEAAQQPEKQETKKTPAKRRLAESPTNRPSTGLELAAADNVNSWTAGGDNPVAVKEYRSGGKLNRITFASGKDSAEGGFNGYESYVAIDGKHDLEPVTRDVRNARGGGTHPAVDPNNWSVAPGATLEVKPFGESPKLWKLGGNANVPIPKSHVLSDDEMKKLGFVEVKGSPVASKKLIPIPMSQGTEYKQADNGDIMRVDWTPASGSDGGTWVRVSGGKGVKLEPTATSYLVKGPATILLKGDAGAPQTIKVDAGSAVEIDRQTKKVKPVQAPKPKSDSDEAGTPG